MSGNMTISFLRGIKASGILEKQAIEEAIKAVEMRTPGKTKVVFEDDGCPYEYCPNCNNMILDAFSYCPECGKALDWSCEKQ